jgi:hypothetical protein
LSLEDTTKSNALLDLEKLTIMDVTTQLTVVAVFTLYVIVLIRLQVSIRRSSFESVTY